MDELKEQWVSEIEAEWQLFLKCIDKWADGKMPLIELKDAYFASVARQLRINAKYVN